MAQRASFVLVHGAFHDSTVWSRILERVQLAGHRAIAVDLPGRPRNPLPIDQVTLQAHRDQVLAVVSGESDSRIILVGHSFGGVVISAVAEVVPQQIDTLVYVAGYLPKSGQSARKLSMDDLDSLWNDRNFVMSPDTRTATILGEDAIALLGEDLAPADRERLPDMLVPEPLLPIRTPVILSSERFGQVDKVYIKTLHDRTISPALQDRMLARSQVRQTLELASGHSPYLSQPDALTQMLLTAAG
ncbi:MAG TPA: alpha/beta fold hydrolase [Steroidobacteraceae bacterium]